MYSTSGRSGPPAFAFDEHEVPGLLMKGASLVDRYYHDDSLRAYGDVDMLVPSQRFADALSILEEAGFSILDRNWHMLRAGYARPAPPPLPRRSRHAGAALASDQSEPGPPHPFGDRGRPWSDASRTRVAGADVWVPRTSRELAHLCLHAALHGCDRLIWLVDIHKVMDSPDLDLDDLQRTARHWGFGAGTYLVFALVDRWLGSLATPTGSLEAPPGPRDPRRVPPARGPVGPWPARSRRAVPAAALRDRGRRRGAPRRADLVTRGAAGRQRSGCGQGATRPAAFPG